MSFFSIDLEKKVSDIRSGKYSKSLVERIFNKTPNAYYWYGNPNNWSYCYEIKLDEKKEIVIRKIQLLILESKYNQIKSMDMETQASLDADNLLMGEILLIYSGDYPYNYADDLSSYPEYLGYIGNSVSSLHTSDKLWIDSMINNYKFNVSIKNGYIDYMQEVWDEYNKIQERAQRISVKKDKKYLMNYKPMESKEISELETKFIVNYEERIQKLKEDKNFN